MHFPAWAIEILLLAALLVVVALLVRRLPKVDMGHSDAFLRRRVINWLPVGPYASWSFFIGIKASILSDVKLDQRTQPDRVLK